MELALQLFRVHLIVRLDKQASRGGGGLWQPRHILAQLRLELFVCCVLRCSAILSLLGNIVDFVWLVVRWMVPAIGQDDSWQRFAVQFLCLVHHLTAMQALEAAEVEELHGEFYVRYGEARLAEPAEHRLARLRV